MHTYCTNNLVKGINYAQLLHWNVTNTKQEITFFQLNLIFFLHVMMGGYIMVLTSLLYNVYFGKKKKIGCCYLFCQLIFFFNKKQLQKIAAVGERREFVL